MARWVLVAVLALPVVAGIAVGLRFDAHSVADWALIELRVFDVGTPETPLLGPFSRFGWNHPGPLLFYVLAPAYRALGATSDALFVAAGLVNLLALLGIAWQAWRRGGLALLAWTALLGVLFLRGQPTLFVVDPWNPTIVELPFLLLGFLTWSLAEGDRRLAPLWVLVASSIVQSHIGFAPIVVAFGVWGLVWLLARRGRAAAGSLAAAFALGLVLWLPPVVEQLTTAPGNLGNLEKIARHYFGDRDAESARDLTGVDKAARVYGQQLAPAAVLLGRHERTQPFTRELRGSNPWSAAPAVAALVLAAALAIRRRRADAARLAGQIALALVVGFFVAARIDGLALAYLFGWLEVLAVLLWLSIGWSVWRSLARSGDDARPVLAVAALAAAVSLLASWRIYTDLRPPLLEMDRAVAALSPPTLEAVAGRRAYVIHAGRCFYQVSQGVSLQLVRNGVSVIVSDEFANRFGAGRLWNGSNADVHVIIACTDAVDEAFALAERAPDVEVVASWDPFLAELEAKGTGDALRKALHELGRDDLVPDIANGRIAETGPAAGIGENLLIPYRRALKKRNERVVVLLGTRLGRAGLH